MKYVKLLTGELIPIEDDDDIHRVREKVCDAIEVSSKDVYIDVIQSDHSDNSGESKEHEMSVFALVYPRSQYVIIQTQSVCFGDCLRKCVNESILSYLVEKMFLCEWTPQLFSNAHPLVVKHLLLHLESSPTLYTQRVELAGNPSDHIISHPLWQKLLTSNASFRTNVCCNPNVRAISNLVEVLKTLPKEARPSVDSMCLANFDVMIKFISDEYGVETLLRCSKFLSNSSPLASTIRLQYLNFIERIHGHYMCSSYHDSELVELQRQYVRRMQQLGTLEVLLPDIIRYASPLTILMCMEEMDVRMLSKISWFSKVSHDDVVNYLLERPRSISWPYFLLNLHPRAIQKSLEWLKNKKYQSIDFAEICVVFPEIQSVELIECILTECRDIEFSPEIQIQLASRVPDLKVVFV